VVSRRELLALGSATLLVGCGKDQEPPVPPPAPDALLRSMEAERAVTAALTALEAPRRERDLVRTLAFRADERAQQAAAAVAALTGRSHDPSAPAGGDVEPEAALERLRAALATHVEAMPSLRGREFRRLGTNFVTGSAGDLALLAAVFGSPSPAEAFPGTPT
jgi:hypothetical protein